MLCTTTLLYRGYNATKANKTYKFLYDNAKRMINSKAEFSISLYAKNKLSFEHIPNNSEAGSTWKLSYEKEGNFQIVKLISKHEK